MGELASLDGNRPASESASPAPKGIRGWLILPALGTFVSPFLIVKGGVVELVPVLAGLGDGASFGLRAFLVWELTINSLLALGWICAAYLLLRHSRWYPPLFNGLCIVSLIYIAGDAAVAMAAFGVKPDVEWVRQLVKAIGSVVIWVPYMLKSRRVRNTFVK